MTMASIAHLVQICVQGSGRDLMQQRLPDMSGVALDQNNVVVSAPISSAQSRDELKTARTTADNDNLRFFQVTRRVEGSAPVAD